MVVKKANVDADFESIESNEKNIVGLKFAHNKKTNSLFRE